MAACWNNSLLDIAPFVICEVFANQEFNRQNADISQGQDSRRISELRTGMTLPSVLVTSIWFGIPHSSRTKWRQNLFDAFVSTFHFLLHLPLPHSVPVPITPVQWASCLCQLTAARLAYRASDGAMDESFGGHYSEVPSNIIGISISLTLILDALQTSSERNRSNKLLKFPMTSLPEPIMTVFFKWFPELRVWTNREAPQETYPQWTIGPTSSVSPWFTQ